MAATLNDLRALIKDHQQRDSGLTVDVEVPLKTWLADDIRELEITKATRGDQLRGSLAEGGADTDDLDEQIAALRKEQEESTITVHFRALPEPEYRELLRAHPDAHDGKDIAAYHDFLAALMDECYQGVSVQGQPVKGMEPEEWRVGLTVGPVEQIGQLVLALNRNPHDTSSSRPKSSRR